MGRENPEGGIETNQPINASSQGDIVWEERIPREGLKLEKNERLGAVDGQVWEERIPREGLKLLLLAVAVLWSWQFGKRESRGRD